MVTQAQQLAFQKGIAVQQVQQAPTVSPVQVTQQQRLDPGQQRVTIGNVTTTRQTVEKVLTQLQREIEGRKGSILFGPEEMAARKAILGKVPELERAVAKGQTIALELQRRGGITLEESKIFGEITRDLPSRAPRSGTFRIPKPEPTPDIIGLTPEGGVIRAEGTTPTGEIITRFDQPITPFIKPTQRPVLGPFGMSVLPPEPTIAQRVGLTGQIFKSPIPDLSRTRGLAAREVQERVFDPATEAAVSFVDVPEAKFKERERVIFEELEKNVENFDKKVEAFNKKFGDRELNPFEAAQANEERERLLLEQEVIEQRTQELEILAQERKEREFSVLGGFFGGVRRGAAGALIGLPSGVATAVIDPRTFQEDIVSSTFGLGGALITQPVSTTGELVGAFGILGPLSRGASRLTTTTQTITKTRKFKPKVSQSIEFDDAIKVGVDAQGNNIYNVKGRIVTKIIDPKTGKTIETLSTDTFSQASVGKTASGAIEGTAETLAATLRKAGLRRFAGQKKITAKFNVKRAKGKVKLEGTDVDEVLKGLADSDIVDVGTLRLRQTPLGITGRLQRTQAPAEARAISELFSKRLGTIDKTRQVGKVTIGGRQTITRTIARTDITRERIRVKGFVRKQPTDFGDFFGTTKLKGPLKPTGKRRIKPFTRKLPGSDIPSRDFSQTVGGVFEPTEVGLQFGFETPKLPKAPKPKPKKITTQDLSQATELIVNEKQAAASIAQVQTQQIGGLIKGQAAKPISVKETKVTKTTLLSKKGTESVGSLIAPAELQKPVVKQSLGISLDTKAAVELGVREKQFSDLAFGLGNKLSPGLGTKKGTKEIQKTAQGLGILQESKLETLQVQETQQIAPISPFSPIDTSKPPIPVGKTPSKIRFGFIPEVEREKERKVFGYNVFVKKKGKFEKINKKQLDLQTALSKGAREVDTTPAATFKVQKGKKKVKRLKKGDTYYRDNSFKFRNVTVSPVKKRKGPLPKATFIEKRGYRFDKGTERKLSREGTIAKRRKATGNRIF